MVVILATFPKWEVGSIDVTHAFLQADDLQYSDKFFVMAPPYIVIRSPDHLKKCKIPGMAAVDENDIHVTEGSEYKSKSKEELDESSKVGLITHKPLYGGRDAPLRWYLAICAALRYGGWRHCRSDVCTFAKYIKDTRGRAIKPSSIIIAHVGDLLIAGIPNDIIAFGRVVAQFRTGSLSMLKVNDSVEYLGIKVKRGRYHRLGLDQQPYCAKLHIVKLEDVVRNNQFCISTDRWRALQRQLIGSLLWVTQARFEVCAGSNYLSTSAIVFGRCRKSLRIFETIQ